MKEIDLSDEIIRLKDYKGEDRVVSSHNKRDEVAKREKLKPHKFGMPVLDRLCNGAMPGELIAISGPRKSGKTLLSQTITCNFARNGVLSLWFSYEVTDELFIERFGEEVPFFMMPNKLKMNSMEWLRERILEAIAKTGLHVVFIDHLHYLFDLANNRSVSLEIGQIIRWLKLLAVELKIVIVLMCHMTKVDPFEEPSDMSIRDSAMVSAESDTSIVVWRDRNHQDVGNVKVCFHRRTGVIEEKFQVKKIDGLFEEYAEGYDDWSR
jgi:replicative DNA helicase